jgi:hypothetical protein
LHHFSSDSGEPGHPARRFQPASIVPEVAAIVAHSTRRTEERAFAPRSDREVHGQARRARDRSAKRRHEKRAKKQKKLEASEKEAEEEEEAGKCAVDAA